VAIVASSSAGYILGSGPVRQFQSAVVALNPVTTVTTTVSASSSTVLVVGSVPLEPDPYEYSLIFSSAGTTWYVPIVFLAGGTVGQMYVNYVCSARCPGNNPESILPSNISSDLPEGFSLGQTGKLNPTESLRFQSAAVIYSQNRSETILYTFSLAGNGYYTFSFPFGCSQEPILYVKPAGSSFNYSPIKVWLQSLSADSIRCSDRFQVTILGFTNSYYTQIPVLVNTT